MEAQGSGNVITSSRDDYLLNKCSDRYRNLLVLLLMYSVSDPNSCGSVLKKAPRDPDPYLEYGSGYRTAQMTSKKEISEI